MTQLVAGFNDLATVNPKLAVQAHGWDPSTVTAMSNKKLSWICDEGHVWDAVVYGRSRGNSCPVHAGRQVLVGYNDLATTHPELAKQAHGWDPTTVTAMSNKKLDWICEEGHVWAAHIYNRSVGNRCPYCSGQKVRAGYNDLATVNPELAAQAHGWDPTTVTASCRKKVAWKCELDHIWGATVAHRSRGSGCPICADRRFKPELDAHLYFLEHPERDLYQIGISNEIKRRLNEHAGKGWEVIEVSEVMPGHQAHDYERDGCKAIKSRGGCFTDLLGKEMVGGYSEVWTRKSFRPKSLTELIQMVDADRRDVAAPSFIGVMAVLS
jgi:translation initiation factor IF-1